MIMIFFFYGLAFFLLGGAIFTMPKRKDYLNISGDLWLVGLFGVMHGINEWMDLFILRGGPFNVYVLKIAGSILLPLSFACLVIFGARIIVRQVRGFAWFNLLWLASFLIWAVFYILDKEYLTSGILARYFIGIPGTFLSALGLLLVLSRSDRTNMPKTIYISAMVSIVTLIMYGVLSGLVVPKANFFPASIINYENFMSIFLMPVQFYRMLCAIILTISFFWLTAFFYLHGGKIAVRGGIRNKIVLIICSSVLLIMFVAIGLTYTIGISTLHNIIGKEYTQIADMIGGYISEEIKGEVDDVESYVTRPLWSDLVREANLKYAGMDKEDITRQLLDMDKKWISSEGQSLLMNQYLGTRVSLSMRDLLKVRKNVSELFITDKFGGLVASSGKTSDFYQADESWWQESYNGGKGSIYLSNVEFDESSNEWVISIAVPIIYDKEVVGICKVSVSIKKLFEGLNNFKLGRTGHASLTNKDGYVLFHCDIPTMSKRLYREALLRKLFNGDERFGIINDEEFHKNRQFVAFSRVPISHISKNEIDWIVFIDQDAVETFEPINRLIIDIALIVVFLIIIMIPISYFFSNIIVKHIHKLHLATEKISEGDLSYKIEVNTGDEIEQLADSFTSMVSNIKTKQDELIRAKTELEQLSRSLEDKVSARTRDLEKLNEATLNVLEDLTEAKHNVDKYSKELEDAIKIKSDFTSMVSHELRTPLTAIKEGIAIVLDGAAGTLNKDQAQFLDIAKRNVDRLTRLINDILDFQKLESGKMLFAMHDNDINESVQEVYKTMLPLANSKGLTITLNEDRALPKVRFDKDKIAQVLANLVNNAIKFTENGGITITTSMKGENTVQVSVSDTGHGIKEEDIPKLFHQFEQLEKGVDRKTAGTGLGLVISKEIIERHGGKIWAESKYGSGASFIFLLPIKERRAWHA